MRPPANSRAIRPRIGELLGGDIAERELDGDDVVAVLFLGAYVARDPPVEDGRPLPAALYRHKGGGLVNELRREFHEGLGIVGLLGPGLFQLFFDLLTEGVNAYPVDVELDPGLHSVTSEFICAVEDADYGLADPEEVLDGDEVVESVGESGMMEVPPPVIISKPRRSTPFSSTRTLGLKARSWIAVTTQSSLQEAKATLNFRGSAWAWGCRTNHRAKAAR